MGRRLVEPATQPRVHMKRWLRRFLYLLIVLIWIAIMSLPFLAVMVAARGQVQLGDDTGRHLRIFLVQQRGAAGIGIENQRPLRQSTDCTKTTVTYLLWEGTGENASYCQCIDSNTGANLPVDAGSCAVEQ